MKLNEFCEEYNITLIGNINLNENIQLDNIYDYYYNDCGHRLNNALRTIRRNAGNCSKCKRVSNYQRKHGITVDFEESTFECTGNANHTGCYRMFNREPNKLLYNIGLYKCICRLKSVKERELYDLLYEKFPDKLYRNFLYENDDNKNFTGDFYLKLGDNRTLIIALDDESHKVAKNRSNDKEKMDLVKNKNNIYTIHLEQDMLSGNIGWIIDEIELDILNPETLPKVRLYGSEDVKLYRYMVEHLDRNNIEYEYIDLE